MNDKRRRSRGQSLVEFALVAPLFLMMFFGVIELGRLVWTHHELTNGTREGARLAMVRGSESTSPLTSTSEIKDRILNTTVGLSSGSLTVSATGLGGDPGTSVSVTSTYSYDVLVGIIPGLGDMTISRTSTVIIQH
jgi:Flp pilus assembly protein TadG